MKDNSSLYLMLTPILIGLFSASAYFIGTRQTTFLLPKTNIKESAKINQVLDLIEYEYVDSVNRNKLIENSILGMLKELDPHSSYIPPKDVAKENEGLQGHFGGIGIRFIIIRDTLMITNVIPDGPSEATNLKSGDRIINVDGENIAGIGLTNDGVLKRLKGPFDSKVELIVLNTNSKIQKKVQVTRGKIKLPSIDASFLIKNKIGYIKLSSFSDKTSEEFKTALSNLKNNGMEKLILDLRNNGGGYLKAAKDVTDEFLSNEKHIVYTEGIHNSKNLLKATSYGGFESGDLIILVNSGSASASEIVSGAIQDNDRGLIIGRRTFGKGLVQQPFPLSDHSEIRLTVSRYYTPTGRCIQKPYGNGIDYNNDLYKRYESGEMQEFDSTLFKDAEKFFTPKGKIVYGGGGIMPDIFVALDTIGSSDYFSDLYYSSAYRDFCFDYYDKNKSKMKYKNLLKFNSEYNVSEKLFNAFTNYVEKNLGIKKNKTDIQISKNRINNRLKSELATYLFNQEARYYVALPFDQDVQRAVIELEKTQ